MERIKVYALNDAMAAGLFQMDEEGWLERDADLMPVAQRALETYEDAVNRRLNRLL
ncbi:hypothetical protein ACWDUB_16240 [Streptomyces fungicidicus]